MGEEERRRCILTGACGIGNRAAALAQEIYIGADFDANEWDALDEAEQEPFINAAQKLIDGGFVVFEEKPAESGANPAGE